MSLKEELSQLVKTISSDDNAQFFPDGYVEWILSTISKHLPEKKKILEVPKPLEGIDQLWLEGRAQGVLSGYNLAIDQINKLLTTNKKGEV